MIVVGLGYGDEGKGLTTSFLCEQTKNPIVVRFNGGHQAGHTVVYRNRRHIFSHFGAGTLQNVPTYWSNYCTFEPCAFVNEFITLDDPLFFVDPLCPVTTPYEVMHNQFLEQRNRHGSVGVGFGSTINRQENNYKLFVQDLFCEPIFHEKMKMIKAYYTKQLGYDDVFEEDLDNFFDAVKTVKKIIKMQDKNCLYWRGYNPIFEGAQGILLDMDFGVFPNVTRSNTTSKNALSLYKSGEIYYVTRTYLTRHGNGFLPDEEKLELVNNENETNKTHEFQGEFRTAELNIDLLNHALQIDHNFSSPCKRNLVVTCFDQYPIDIPDLVGNLKCSFDKIFVSSGDSLNDIKQIRLK